MNAENLEDKLELQKERLIEKLGVNFEQNNVLAPVAARIFSTLILIGNQGATFDQLVSDIKASKSTVSTHLEQLQSTGKIRYFTKSGDRKRYFVINSNLMLTMIDEMLEKWEAEKEIHKKVLDYKNQRNEITPEERPFDLEFQNNYLTFLEEATAAMQKLKSNIINKNIH